MVTAAADVIALGLPDSWQDLPLEATEFEGYLSTVLDELTDAGVDRVERRRVEILQRQLRQLLLAEDVRYVSVIAEPVARDEFEDPDELPEDALGVLCAAAVVSVDDRGTLGAPGPLTAEMLVRGVENRGTVELDPPRRIELPAGPTARFAWLQRASAGPDGPAEVLVQSYLVPFDAGQRLCTLQLVTPNIPHGGEFSDLFDGIAETLRIFTEDAAAAFAVPSASAPVGTEPTDRPGNEEPGAR
jgi:hypothetical protein